MAKGAGATSPNSRADREHRIAQAELSGTGYLQKSPFLAPLGQQAQALTLGSVRPCTHAEFAAVVRHERYRPWAPKNLNENNLIVDDNLVELAWFDGARALGCVSGPEFFTRTPVYIASLFAKDEHAAAAHAPPLREHSEHQTLEKARRALVERLLAYDRRSPSTLHARVAGEAAERGDEGVKRAASEASEATDSPPAAGGPTRTATEVFDVHGRLLGYRAPGGALDDESAHMQPGRWATSQVTEATRR